MNKGFVFDAAEDDDLQAHRRVVQSPWEFSGYAKASEQEHRERNTTSIDHKISQRLNAGKKPTSRSSNSSEDDEDEILEESWAKVQRSRRKKTQPVEVAGEESDDEEDDSAIEAIDNEEEEEEEEAGEEEQEETEDEEQEEEAEPEAEEEEQEEDDEENENSQAETEQEEEEDEAEIAEYERSSNPGHAKKASNVVANGKSANKPGNFFSSAENASFSASSFMELNISRPLVRACEALGYKQPTPIQSACIPLALSGRDICGSAVTGSGKTAAFALPILERLLFRPRRIPAIRVLIVTPTRELAVQLHSMIEKLGQFTDIRCCLVVGGLSSKVQEVALRTHPDIVIATPGRMIDHLRNTQSVGLEELAILVLDEADRLLELGFREEIHELVKLCPSRRQTMLFSATMTDEVSELIKLSLKSPVRLSADVSTQRPSTLTEEVIRVRPERESEKEAILLSLCSRSFTAKTIVFSGTKVEAHRLKILFGLSGLKAAELHGNLTQAQRLEALEAFRKQEVDFLIATDVAARGLDIIGVESVINFQIPKDITTYVHRVGRTARAGRSGRAVTLMTENDRQLLKAVAKRAGSKLQKRVVPPASIASWDSRIKEYEEDVHQIFRQEREEKLLRKAEMEANKAQNMMDHAAEIFSRPKKTWFQSDRDKSRIAQEAKGSASTKKIASVNEAAEQKRKEKRRVEKEKSLPRRKRRRLEAAREAAEEEAASGDDDDYDGDEADHHHLHNKAGDNKNAKNGPLLVDIGYKRARAVKAVEKAKEQGRFIGNKRDKKKMGNKNKARRSEEDENGSYQAPAKRNEFQAKKFKRKPGVTKGSFKSKSRFKRRK